MGEKVYRVGGPDGTVSLMFSEGDDNYSCLCTFPHNNVKSLDAETVVSLALFGAAVRLAHSGLLEKCDSGDDQFYRLPEDVPDWIREEIDRVVFGM